MTLREYLHAAQVTCAHLIDDAFDQVPASAPTPEEIQAFLEGLEDKDLDAVGAALGLKVFNEDAIRSGLADYEKYIGLFHKEKEIPASQPLFADFHTAQQAKLAKIE